MIDWLIAIFIVHQIDMSMTYGDIAGNMASSTIIQSVTYCKLIITHLIYYVLPSIDYPPPISHAYHISHTSHNTSLIMTNLWCPLWCYIAELRSCEGLLSWVAPLNGSTGSCSLPTGDSRTCSYSCNNGYGIIYFIILSYHIQSHIRHPISSLWFSELNYNEICSHDDWYVWWWMMIYGSNSNKWWFIISMS